ncbi:carboxy methyl transferase for protein phosphatase 2A [Tulasnella sp. 418]|nr:carboxy methyl transferase for protein phosphatase 2A [Tulasnella sp. 418]
MAGVIPTRDGDSAIRATDSDATQARLSAVRKQYLQDPFVHHFIQRPHLVPNRPPLINIGTYVRSESIDALITEWFSRFESNISVQIVSLGAGSDTRFWRLSNGPYATQLTQYIEVDFPEVTARKLATIRKNNDLLAITGDLVSEQGGTGCRSLKYHLVPADLREEPQNSLSALLEILDSQTPTLVIAECVFAYMPPSASERILLWFKGHFSPIGCMIYEMFALGDSFGTIMKENLRTRNIVLPGVDGYGDLESLCTRFAACGFKNPHAKTLKSLWLESIHQSEVQRVTRLEHVDEWEEILLVLDHYALSWAFE